jgi:hypothetical protein
MYAWIHNLQRIAHEEEVYLRSLLSPKIELKIVG